MIPASSRRFRRSARMLVGMPSGEAQSSPYVRLPWRMSRTTSSDHLSPTTSSVPAIGQRDLRLFFGLAVLARIRVRVGLSGNLHYASHYATLTTLLHNASE